ncbi:fluoride efflux transporter CrcB [Sphingomonas sp. PAMC26645]|uniref:fluoride efflux transporter CrcB n=1 Tax=Sphingomonas sp. PAMC26645 TaxID=2565555 RepID=UPI00109DE028|nr:fluoride efflux transporter CrcB [Sphingomonas sp. PAMC26645]QCB41756.1 fluoride efflux transporter CrcB [Sphingomonas sp. PAMC26645]
MGYLIVFFGAGVGGVFRQALGSTVTKALGPDFPYGTLLINVTGSAIMGLVIGVFEARNIQSNDLRLFLTTGILGGYTTFSTFSLDSVMLWERGQYVESLAYVSTSLILSLSVLALTMMLVRRWA